MIGEGGTAAIVDEENRCGVTACTVRLDDFRVFVHSMRVAQKLKCQVTVGPGNIELRCNVKKTNTGKQAEIVEVWRSKPIIKADRIIRPPRRQAECDKM